jgi:hypothetical protein
MSLSSLRRELRKSYFSFKTLPERLASYAAAASTLTDRVEDAIEYRRHQQRYWCDVVLFGQTVVDEVHFRDVRELLADDDLPPEWIVEEKKRRVRKRLQPYFASKGGWLKPDTRTCSTGDGQLELYHDIYNRTKIQLFAVFGPAVFQDIVVGNISIYDGSLPFVFLEKVVEPGQRLCFNIKYHERQSKG